LWHKPITTLQTFVVEGLFQRKTEFGGVKQLQPKLGCGNGYCNLKKYWLSIILFKPPLYDVDS
jgi:hypothetical protein